MAIQINTSQNVLLSYRPAGIGLRLLSIVLDTVFKYTYFLIIFMFFYDSYLSDNLARGYTSRDEGWQVVLGIFFLLLVPFLLYHLLCETFLDGQSLGKKIVRIKVVKLDGSQPGFGAYLIRSVFRLIDDSIIGLLCIAFSKHTQRIGDMVAGTTVIELNPKVSLANTILQEEKSGYKVVYEQVSLMSDKDANIIREVLEFAQEQQDAPHLRLLAGKIRSKYGIGKTAGTDEEFLNTLLMDYTHYRFEN